MSSDPHVQRKTLTFAQAEGAQELPRQLKLKEVSRELRAKLWGLIHPALENCIYFSSSRLVHCLGAPWGPLLYRKHLDVDHGLVDEFDDNAYVLINTVKTIIAKGDYIKVFGFLQWVLRASNDAIDIGKLKEVLKQCRAAYRLIDDPPTFIPISSEEEIGAINQAFVDLDTSEFEGARTHLRSAAQHLTSGNYADSIRESIHAVESVARLLSGANSLSIALQKLKSEKEIHPALEKGFNAIYGYTSDEKGVRHALVDDATSKVDEADAIFMIGACASFVSYLINRTRDAQ